MHVRFLIALAVALALVLALGGVDAAPALSGRARVVDGDTLELAGARIRLHGIDAPELGQTCLDAARRSFDCGAVARDVLRELAAGGVACRPLERDRYGRIIAVCRAAGRDIGGEMVARGAARAFLRFSHDYEAAEAEAAAAGRGIWAGEADAPWDVRARAWKSADTAAPDGCPIKGNVSGNGRIYHMPHSPWYGRTRIDPKRGERWFCSEREALDAGWRPAGG